MTKRVKGSKAWADSVKKRDKVCMLCGNREYLQAHHVLVYDKFKAHRLDRKNGLTVCVECHLKIHVKGGGYGKKRLRNR